MKKNKLLAIVLCVAMIVTQFAMLGVSAETTYTALSGNDDFLMGVNIHPSKNYAAYSNTYEALKDSEALGSNIIRIDGSPANAGEMAYYASVGDVAAEKGMQVMLVNAGKFLSFVQATEVENEGTENETVTTRFLSVSELDLAAITAYYTELATVLNGRVKYYQLGNEMDNQFYKGDSSDHGATYSSNSYYDVTAAAVALNVAKEAIQAVDSEAQVGVNFNYYHRGFIHGLKSVDCDPDTEGTQTLALDYIGMDFYSNQIEEGVFGIGAADYTDNIEDLAQYNEPIIVCEANITATSWDESDNTQITYEKDAAWLADFLTYCYESTDVAGFIAYELYDQPAMIQKDTEGNPVFNREAFFGLIDKDGNKKDTYNVLQQLFGGTGVSSEDDMPQMPETVDAVITDDVIMYAYGKDVPTNQTGGNDARITLDTPIDLSAASYIECDIYVSDAENFNAYSANGEKLALILYTGDGATGKRAYFEINTTVTEGWNHFKFDKTSCRSRGATGSYPWKIDWSDVNVVSFGTHNRNETASFTGTGTALITNIYATIAERDKVPEVKLTGLSPVPLYEDMCFSGAWIDGKVNTSKTIDPTVDISTCDYIEFDVYIENYENFMQYETSSVNGTWVPVFITGSNASTGAYRYKINKYVTKSGWNHVVIPIDEYDSKTSGTNALTKINHVGLRFEPKDGNTIHVGEHYAIANVYATREEYKVAPEVNLTGLSPVTLYEDICFSGAWIDGKVNTSKTIDPTVDISNCDYIEFDVYIENYENFMQYETSSVIEIMVMLLTMLLLICR